MKSNNLTQKAKELANHPGTAAGTEQDWQTSKNEEDIINIEIQNQPIGEAKESSKNSTSEKQSAEKKSKKISDDNKDSVTA